ncbi:MAG: hypothetical protein SGPRY_000145 [Prymnesium sp.]
MLPFQKWESHTTRYPRYLSYKDKKADMLHPPAGVKQELERYACAHGACTPERCTSSGAAHSSTVSVVSGEDLDLTDECEHLDTSWAEWSSQPLPEPSRVQAEYAAMPAALAFTELQPDVFIRSREAVRSNTFDSWDKWDEFNPRDGEDKPRASPSASSLRRDTVGSASKARRVKPARRPRFRGSILLRLLVVCSIAVAGLALILFK